VLVPVAALLAGVGIALAGIQLVGPAAGPPAAAAGTGATTGVTDGIVLLAADYVGRPVEQVAGELGAMGLRVDLMAHPSVLAPAGQVTGISPSGTLRPGDLVTVAYATQPDLGPAPAPAGQAIVADPGGSDPAPQPAVVGGAEGAGTPVGSGDGPGTGATNGNGRGNGSGNGNGQAGGNGNGQANGNGNGNGRGND
jgi:hypothetical protein